MDMENIMPERYAPVLYCETISSTNTVLKEMAYNGAAAGTILTAAEQTGGRGRVGRRFESPKKGIYLSLLLRPETDAEFIQSLTPAAAVAVCRAVNAVCGIDAQIKWPNDLLLDGRKICGILTESSTDRAGHRYVVVGIGLNVNTAEEDFPQELRDTAGSLFTAIGRETEIKPMLLRMIDELDCMYASWEEDCFSQLEEYRRRCVTPLHEADVISAYERRRVFVLGVADDYSLLVRNGEGEMEKITFGEVSIRT